MNILQINTHEETGGAAKVANRLHKSFHAMEVHHSSMLVGFKTSQDPDVFVVKTKPDFRLKRSFMIRLGLTDYYLHPLQQTGNTALDNADLVNLHNLHGGYINFDSVKIITNHKPTVWTFHDMWPLTGHCAHSFDCQKWRTGCGNCPYLETYPELKIDLTHHLWKKKRDLLAGSNFTIIAPSQWIAHKIKKSFLQNKPMSVIYNGVDTDVFHQQHKMLARKQLGLPLHRLIVSSVAYMGIKNTWKGGRYLIEAIQRLSQREDIFFLNIGSDEQLEGISQRSYASVGHISREEELALYYSASDLFLFSSLAENCPLVILEAMSCGLPVVTFDVGGTAELVLHKQTGYVASYKDFNDFLKGITLFLEKKAFRLAAGEESRLRVKKYFSLKTQVSKYLRLYAETNRNFNKTRDKYFSQS
ncbi:glycosyltransferase family 4 protein [Candidatus Peregrinibacteria bacterium]|nr:glycosyltransferase family 4 protein [Candidatus Peregrinibacteria bacterium]